MKNSSDSEQTWNETKRKLKQKFGMLSDNDLLFFEGKYDDILRRIQSKLGKSKKEILKIISES